MGLLGLSTALAASLGSITPSATVQSVAPYDFAQRCYVVALFLGDVVAKKDQQSELHSKLYSLGLKYMIQMNGRGLQRGMSPDEVQADAEAARQKLREEAPDVELVASGDAAARKYHELLLSEAANCGDLASERSMGMTK